MTNYHDLIEALVTLGHFFEISNVLGGKVVKVYNKRTGAVQEQYYFTDAEIVNDTLERSIADGAGY